MAGTCTLSWVDAQGENATNSFTVASLADAGSAAAAFKAASNARILSAVFSQVVDISALAGNAAVAANNESARTKAAVTITGPNPTAGLNRITSILEIPAPLGSIINGAVTDKDNALLATIRDIVRGNRGEVLDRVDRVDYAK